VEAFVRILFMTTTPITDKAYLSAQSESDKVDALLACCEQLERKLNYEKELREGDNKLILALAEGAGIKITCDPKLLGLVWEQFHDGVMEMKDRLSFANVRDQGSAPSTNSAEERKLSNE